MSSKKSRRLVSVRFPFPRRRAKLTASALIWNKSFIGSLPFLDGLLENRPAAPRKSGMAAAVDTPAPVVSAVSPCSVPLTAYNDHPLRLPDGGHHIVQGRRRVDRRQGKLGGTSLRVEHAVIGIQGEAQYGRHLGWWNRTASYQSTGAHRICTKGVKGWTRSKGPR